MILHLSGPRDPILRQKIPEIKKWALLGRASTVYKKTVDDMIETLHDNSAVGLAANQVGVLMNIAVIQLPDWKDPLVLVNPKVIQKSGDREVEEGCLSLPGHRSMAHRSTMVNVRAWGLDAKVIKLKEKNSLLAQVLEHEIDHLNGILFINQKNKREGLTP